MIGGILLGISKQASPSWLSWPKLLAEVSGVSWVIRVHWVSGSWVGEARAHDHRSARVEAAPLPIWALLCCLCPLQPEPLAGSVPDVQWVSCCCWPKSGREQAGMLQVSLCSSAPAWEIAHVCGIPKGRSLFPRNRD